MAAPRSPVVDAHHHLWTLAGPFDYRWLDAPEMAPIRRDFTPGDLAPLLDAAGVGRTVVVQTQHDLAENDWALGLADAHGFIAGVVGWVDLASEACGRQAAEYGGRPKFVGVRHVAQDEPDDDWLVREEVIRGLGVLESHAIPFDVLIRPRHLRHVPTLARRLPDLRMVVDHLAKPNIAGLGLLDWLPDFREAARWPNVSCKLSGMVTEAHWDAWSPDDLVPYVQAALDLFGPDRLMFGSDWPVCTLAGSYADVKDALDEALGPVSDDERAAIFGGTATRFYGLDRGS